MGHSKPFIPGIEEIVVIDMKVLKENEELMRFVMFDTVFEY